MKWHQRFFWLLLLFLPTQLGLHFWPEWAMVLGRRVDYLAPTVYLTDILVGLVLFFWLSERSVILGLDPRIHLKKRLDSRLRGNDKLFIFALLFCFILINIFTAENINVALYKWLKVAEFALLGWYIVRSKPSFFLVATSLSVGVLYSSVLAITQFVLQHSIGGPLWWLGERAFDVGTPGIARIALGGREVLRPYATFPHPNVLGGYLAVTLPIVLIRLLGRIRRLGNIKKLEKFFYGSTFAMGIVALFLTFSRSAWVAGTVGIGMSMWYVVFREKKHSFFPSMLYTIPFILFVVLVVWTISPQEESVVVRQQLNAAAISMWQHSPAFGVGLGNFLVELPKNLVSRQIYFLQPVHNIYLLALSEVGVVGLSVIIISFWVLLRHETRDKRQGRKRFILVPCLLSLVSLLVLGLVDHYPLTLQQGQVLLTVLVGMSITLSQSNKVTN